MSMPLTCPPTTGVPAAAISPDTYRFLTKHVYNSTGIVLDGNKEYLLQSRLLPVLDEMKIGSFDALCRTLAKEPSGKLSRVIVDVMTTNETLFFRDFATFEALRAEVLPRLLQRVGKRRLRIWSAASSSGQEAYSVAMMLLEMNVPPEQVQILGTDISELILNKARAGQYSQFEVNRGLPTALLMRYFDRVGLSWTVKDCLRRMVRFEQRDLRMPLPPSEGFDLLLCRNVLIYFDGETKQKILSTLYSSLEPEGILVLGCAETIIQATVPLRREIVQQAAFYIR